MKIALVGYGKMGKAIEKEAVARGHEISFRIGRKAPEKIKALSPENTDAIIEFTHPESIMGNFELLLPKGIPLITGTTGWTDRFKKVKKMVDKHQATLLYGSNFSVGVNILFQLNQLLATLMNRYDAYDCFVEERHHQHKADAPSGTAETLALQIINRLDRKERLATEELRTRPPKPKELSVGYVRSGEIYGEHTVAYTSIIDSLQIHHRAHNRRGFALGAVIGAEWIIGKKGIHDFQELFEEKK